MPNDQNSVSSRQQGASSLIASDHSFDESTNGGSASALAGGGFTFRVEYVSTNDVRIMVKEGGASFGNPKTSRIGNMSSSASSSFSYQSSNISSTSFSEICRFTNIGSGRGQVKLNFVDPTASPYGINASNWMSFSSNRGYTAHGSNSDGDADGTSAPITWPRTTISSPFYHEVTTSGPSGVGTTFKYFYQGETGNSNQITTSYQNIASSGGHGFEIGAIAGSFTDNDEGSSDNHGGATTIIEIVVKDLDGGVEHKCDLLLVFAMATTTDSNQNDEEEGE